jgi:hypothetical protein
MTTTERAAQMTDTQLMEALQFGSDFALTSRFHRALEAEAVARGLALPAAADLFDHLMPAERDCTRFGHDFENGITCQCCGLVDL